MLKSPAVQELMSNDHNTPVPVVSPRISSNIFKPRVLLSERQTVHRLGKHLDVKLNVFTDDDCGTAESSEHR